MEDGNAAVERLYDTANAQGERERDPHLKDALNDVVDRVMSGDRFPKRGFPAIDLWDFLDQQMSLSDQTEWLVRLITCRDELDTVSAFKSEIERRLRIHLVESQFVHDRASEMAEDAREERML